MIADCSAVGVSRQGLWLRPKLAPSVMPDPSTDIQASQSVTERVAAWVVPERNPAGAVYGLIMIGALLAAESGLRDTYPETIGSAGLAVVLYWFAHSYSDVLGLRLDEHGSFNWTELWRTFGHDWAIAKGGGAAAAGPGDRLGHGRQSDHRRNGGRVDHS